MKSRLIIEGNAVYEVDMECMETMEKRMRREQKKNEKSCGERRDDWQDKK